VEFCNEFFFVVNDIELNLRQLRSLKFLVENALKKCVFFHFLSNKCIINFSFWEKTITLKKKGDFINGHCIIFSFFFGLVMCDESQT
jgi:hypothetical protein